MINDNNSEENVNPIQFTDMQNSFDQKNIQLAFFSLINTILLKTNSNEIKSEKLENLLKISSLLTKALPELSEVLGLDSNKPNNVEEEEISQIINKDKILRNYANKMLQRVAQLSKK